MITGDTEAGSLFAGWPITPTHTHHGGSYSKGFHWLLPSPFGFAVQSLSHVRLFATPRTAARQASLCITNSRSLLKLMSIEPVMPSSHLILCYPLLLLPSVFPSIGSCEQSYIKCLDTHDFLRPPVLLHFCCLSPQGNTLYFLYSCSFSHNWLVKTLSLEDEKASFSRWKSNQREPDRWDKRMGLGGKHEDPTRERWCCCFFFLYEYVDELLGASQVAVGIKNSSANAGETRGSLGFRSLGEEGPLE